MDLREIADFTDYFVICSGTSDRMLQALADAINEAVRGKFGQRGRTEGQPQDGWLLIDFGDVVVHLFSPDLFDEISKGGNTCNNLYFFSMRNINPNEK